MGQLGAFTTLSQFATAAMFTQRTGSWAPDWSMTSMPKAVTLHEVAWDAPAAVTLSAGQNGDPTWAVPCAVQCEILRTGRPAGLTFSTVSLRNTCCADARPGAPTSSTVSAIEVHQP